MNFVFAFLAAFFFSVQVFGAEFKPLKVSIPLDSIKLIQSAQTVVPGTLQLVVAFQCYVLSTEYESCGRKEISYAFGSQEFNSNGIINLPALDVPFDAQLVGVDLALVFIVNSHAGTHPFGSSIAHFKFIERDDLAIQKELSDKVWMISETGLPTVNF